ncbi:MAG: HIT family protein [Desulfobulbia bacterium]
MSVDTGQDQTLGDQNYVRRIPLESDQFAVIPSVGPLARGHSLLCPKFHIKSFALLPTEYRSEFAVIKSRLHSLLCRTFEAPIHCFEHGSALASSKILCTVDHAHLHFVPAEVNLLDILLAEGEWLEISPDLANLSTAVGNMEYLYYEAPDGRAFVANASRLGFESQYMRRIFANVMHRSGDWNWRSDLRIEEVDQTFRDLSCAANVLTS